MPEPGVRLSDAQPQRKPVIEPRVGEIKIATAIEAIHQ